MKCACARTFSRYLFFKKKCQSHQILRKYQRKSYPYSGGLPKFSVILRDVLSELVISVPEDRSDGSVVEIQ